MPRAVRSLWLALASFLNIASPVSALENFQPYTYDPNPRHCVAAIIYGYCLWHKAQMHPRVDCTSRRFYVFQPRAGIGDSVGALVGRWLEAMRTGRLFLVDWGPQWDVGLAPPHGIHWGYNAAVAAGLLCPSPDDPAAVFRGEGHPWAGEDREGPDRPALALNELQLLEQIVIPTAAVREGIAAVWRRLMDTPLVIGLQIRAGLVFDGAPERLSYPHYFLGTGDYRRFHLCAHRYAALQRQSHWQVLLVTDNATVREALIAAFGARGVEVLQAPGPIAHVMDSPDDAAAVKAFVDFFSLSLPTVVFVTHQSTFGEMGSKTLGRSPPRYAISSSLCGPDRRPCANPKWPPFCADAEFEFP